MDGDGGDEENDELTCVRPDESGKFLEKSSESRKNHNVDEKMA